MTLRQTKFKKVTHEVSLVWQRQYKKTKFPSFNQYWHILIPLYSPRSLDMHRIGPLESQQYNTNPISTYNTDTFGYEFMLKMNFEYNLTAKAISH